MGFLLCAVNYVQANCPCGYYDPSTKYLFTENLIVYFNESTSFPQNSFEVQSYENGYEKSWNARYRSGANASNTAITNSLPSFNTSLELFVSPPTPLHLVMGGGIRTLRSDILYGTFRSLIRPSQPWVGGSALSMMLDFNETQRIQMSTMNMDTVDSAWINMLLGGEFPDRDLGVNYTVILNSTEYKGVSPWDFTELRFDWTEDKVDYYIGNILSRSAKKKNISSLKWPSTPSPLFLKHWSDGDAYGMGGPPPNRTSGHVGWTRAFFNSSTMTKAQHKEFDNRCHVTDSCLVDDITLRGYSPFLNEATLRWKTPPPMTSVRTFKYVVLSASVGLTVFLLVNITIQRWPTKASKPPKTEKTKFCLRLPPQIALSSGLSSGSTTLASAAITPVDLTRLPSIDRRKGVEDTKIEKISASSIGSMLTVKSNDYSESKKDPAGITALEKNAALPSSTKGKEPVPPLSPH
jgi:hypothetical protein